MGALIQVIFFGNFILVMANTDGNCRQIIEIPNITLQQFKLSIATLILKLAIIVLCVEFIENILGKGIWDRNAGVTCIQQRLINRKNTLTNCDVVDVKSILIVMGGDVVVFQLAVLGDIPRIVVTESYERFVLFPKVQLHREDVFLDDFVIYESVYKVRFWVFGYFLERQSQDPSHFLKVLRLGLIGNQNILIKAMYSQSHIGIDHVGTQKPIQVPDPYLLIFEDTLLTYILLLWVAQHTMTLDEQISRPRIH